MSSASRSEHGLKIGRGGLIHGSAVAFGKTAGVLVLGASGTGKSALCLELMAQGATLVSDDQVLVEIGTDTVRLRPPETIAGQIEARGVGLLAAEWAPAQLRLVVDLGTTETDRLPPQRFIAVGPHAFPLFHKIAFSHFPAAITQYMKGGRTA